MPSPDPSETQNLPVPVRERLRELEQEVAAGRKVEAALARTEEHLDGFFQISLDLLCIAGEDGYFKRINPAYSRTLGYTDAELLGQPFVNFVHPEDHAATFKAMEKLNSGEKITNFQNRYRHKDGHYLWFDWSAVVGPEGDFIYATARDVTHQKMEAARLRKEKREAVESSRTKSAALANLSHEIRTPMNAIIGMTELMLNTKLDERQEEYQRLVQSSAESLLSVLNDVLEVTQKQEGLQSLFELDPHGKTIHHNREEPGAQPPATPAKPSIDAKPDAVPTLEVLVAEDGRANQVVAMRFLERRGHNVTIATNGREALEALAERRFDAVLMDIHMPEMNGIEATIAIRKAEESNGGHLPIIAVTANAMQGDREAFLAAGMDEYLAKPVRAAELYQVLERLAVPGG